MVAAAKKVEPTTKPLPISKLRRDGGTQIRVALNEEHVCDLVEALRAGAVIPPVIAYFDGTFYWLADGFHRVEAGSRLELPRIVTEIRAGTQRDAVLHAVGANATHWGLRRSVEDKRNAVLTLMRDEEWRAWSDRKIAECCGVSHPFVASIRVELSGMGYQSPTMRRGADGRVIETTNIRLANAARRAEEPPPPPVPQLSPMDTLALHEISALARLAALCAEFEREFVFIFERMHLHRWGDQREAAKNEIQRVTEVIERELRR